MIAFATRWEENIVEKEDKGDQHFNFFPPAMFLEGYFFFRKPLPNKNF